VLRPGSHLYKKKKKKTIRQGAGRKKDDGPREKREKHTHDSTALMVQRRLCSLKMPLENKTRKMRRDELPVVVVVECSV
jgi:hypothetical protein